MANIVELDVVPKPLRSDWTPPQSTGKPIAREYPSTTAEGGEGNILQSSAVALIGLSARRWLTLTACHVFGFSIGPTQADPRRACLPRARQTRRAQSLV
jgi:hypothetical protein